MPNIFSRGRDLAAVEVGERVSGKFTLWKRMSAAVIVIWTVVVLIPGPDPRPWGRYLQGGSPARA